MAPAVTPEHLSSIPLLRMWERVEVTRSDSETALFFDLMYLGEMAMKMVVAAMVAAIEHERDRHRYRLEHRLVRANGIGEWASVLDEILVGPPGLHLIEAGGSDKRELVKNWSIREDTWQRQVVDELNIACRGLDDRFEQAPEKTSLRWWFHSFAWLRNRTRGHGAPTASGCIKGCAPLERSLRLLCENRLILGRPWIYLRRNLSGKYRVIRVSGDASAFERLKSEKEHKFVDGLHVDFDGDLRTVALIETDVDLSDFYIANGAFRETPKREPVAVHEVFSYISDTRRSADGTPYLLPPVPLPPSETAGRPQLDVQGRTFGNIPPTRPDYVRRPDLETTLETVLRDDRHPIITLVGRGGVGKTSLALEVLHSIANTDEFFAIVWFSARDIDLLPHGPRLVTAAVRTQEEIAAELTTLMAPATRGDKGFKSLEYLAEALSGSVDDGPFLFVFDNFETVANPGELYRFIDTYVRLPNKVLLTSRFRDFKADYPVEVHGMERVEFEELVAITAAKLGIGDKISEGYLDQLYDESDGHPYVIRIVLGEVARSGAPVSLRRVLATSVEILDTLFERTFLALSPAAQRVFLTLCNWRSMVPRLALEAALARPRNERMDVRGAVDSLERSSVVEIVNSREDDMEFVRVPLAAFTFGARKLRISPMKAAVDADTAFLQAFGAMRPTDVDRGLAPRIERMITAVATRIQDGVDVSDDMAILQYVASRYPRTWLRIADLQAEAPDLETNAEALQSLERYLEIQPDDRVAWQRMVEFSRHLKDVPRELNAWFRLATFPDADYQDIAAAAGCLNHHLAQGSLTLGGDEKALMIERLLALLVSRKHEADATDLSRIAWLYLRLKRVDEAKNVVADGLRLEPGNTHCLRLAERLGM